MQYIVTIDIFSALFYFFFFILMATTPLDHQINQIIRYDEQLDGKVLNILLIIMLG